MTSQTFQGGPGRSMSSEAIVLLSGGLDSTLKAASVMSRKNPLSYFSLSGLPLALFDREVHDDG